MNRKAQLINEIADRVYQQLLSESGMDYHNKIGRFGELNDVFDFADKIVRALRDISSHYQELKRFDNLPNSSLTRKAIELEEFIRKQAPAPLKKYIQYVSRETDSSFSYPEADYFSNLANNIFKVQYHIKTSGEVKEFEEYLEYLGPKVAELLEIAINL